MIEVLAKLGRGPVFLAGEVLECVITFTNPLSASSTSASSEMLAWASAQIHCQFHTSENRVALPPSDGSKHDVQAENETVFVPNRGERGQCILSTPPKILFCDLRLDPGESKSYSYCETLPIDGPPSFRGQSVKYVYKLTIGCQRVNSPIKLLRVPFRVLVLHGLKDYQFPQDEAVAPSNPFLEEEEGLKKDSRLADLATELLMQSLILLQPFPPSSSCSTDLYNISNTRGKVGTFCIFKTVYKIGEDVIGTFNFSEGDIPCLQVSAGFGVTVGRGRGFRLGRGGRDSCCPHPLWCWLLTPLLPTVSLKWRLHFEFVTSGESSGTCLVRGSQSEAVTWTGVEQIEVDTFSWDLPIKVLPTNPILASYVSQFSSTNSITI
ncbi:RGP1 protein, partial [Ibidorhyncha struthersii]|nr:RGP1 protein [Ibidorhyncha struthersii]